jgi:hypothetical protein
MSTARFTDYATTSTAEPRRRVRDLNTQAGAGQDELFPAWRYHAVFTDSPFGIQAEGQQAASRRT